MGHFSFRKRFILVALILYWAFFDVTLLRRKKNYMFRHINIWGKKWREQLIKICYHVAIVRMFADRIKRRTSRDL